MHLAVSSLTSTALVICHSCCFHFKTHFLKPAGELLFTFSWPQSKSLGFKSQG